MNAMLAPSTLLTLFGFVVLANGQDTPPTVFRSDVSLVRVDVQVLDRDNKTITGLKESDFRLTESGKAQQIRNFQSENMPLDVVLLFDVSRSMRPHVQRVVSAAHQALRVLGKDDRVAIMVFDRNSRVRLPFRSNLDDVERELDQTVKKERFDGGTDITRALLDSASYVGKEGRATARHAVVILTDDETERERNEEAVERALTKADAVLSLLLAPYSMENQGPMQSGRGGGRGRRGGMGGMGGGGPMGGGGVWGIGLPGQRYPNGGQQGGSGPYGGGGTRTTSAGTAEIARASGGDDFSVDDAGALENTLNRLRQRYALHFNSAEAKTQFLIDVQLADAAATRYPNAEMRFRRASNATGSREPLTVTKSANENNGVSRRPTNPRRSEPDDSEPAQPRRRSAVSEPGTPAGPMIQPTKPPPV